MNMALRVVRDSLATHRRVRSVVGCVCARLCVSGAGSSSAASLRPSARHRGSVNTVVIPVAWSLGPPRYEF